MNISKDFSLCDGYIHNISVISGIRPYGRTINTRSNGRNTHGFLYLRSGSAYFESVSGKTLTVKEREIAIIPKGQKYIMTYNAPSTDFIVVNFDMLSTNGENLTLSDEIALLAKDDDQGNRFSDIMSALECCSMAKSFIGFIQKKELMYKLLRTIYSDKDNAVKNILKNPKITPGVLLLEQTYLKNLPISEFAKASNMCISSFRELFRKQYGTSPLQYRNNLRIEKAKKLICDGDYTVTEAAYACGFENLGYFSRYYKKVIGESPNETKNKVSFSK